MVRHFACRGRVGSSAWLALVVISLVITFAYAPRAAAQTANSAYTICYVNANSGKEYLSGIFDAGKFDAHAHERQTWGPGELAFQNYIYMNVETQIASAGCQVYPSLARAQQILQIWKNEEKASSRTYLVETGWVYQGPESNPPAQAAKPGQYVLCFSDANQSPFYLSGDIHIDEPPHPNEHMYNTTTPEARALDHLKSEFLAFIQKQYGYHTSSSYPATCQGNYNIPRDVTAERDLLHSRFHQLKFVETGWVPGMKTTADLSPKPVAPAASPAMSAYEQAMMAQKPKSVSGSALQQSMKAANGTASSKPAATPAQLYAFCGGGVTANGHTTYYMTKLFDATPSMQPLSLFSTWLSQAHPHNQTSGISCSSPQAMNLLEPSRQHAMEIQRKSFSVVEVTWNPEM